MKREAFINGYMQYFSTIYMSLDVKEIVINQTEIYYFINNE